MIGAGFGLLGAAWATKIIESPRRAAVVDRQELRHVQALVAQATGERLRPTVAAYFKYNHTSAAAWVLAVNDTVPLVPGA